MITEDRACVDVLTQIAATQAAIKKVALAVVEERLQRELRDGDREQAIDDVREGLARLLRIS